MHVFCELIFKQLLYRFLDSSDRPQIEILNKDQVKVGQNITLVCLAENGNPPPRLTWFLGDRAMKTQYEYDFSTQVDLLASIPI
jgi:hypothetical protein